MPFRLYVCLLSVMLFPCLNSAMAESGTRANNPQRVVGCQHIVTPGGLELGLWYPSSGTTRLQTLGPYEQECVAEGPIRDENHALIVISHGTGGSWTSHLDSAAALAQAGYIVVALTEPGDNWRDTSHVTDLAGRTRAMSAALTYMLSDSPLRTHIDSNRVGAFGFSAGGLTALLAAGARPDLARLRPWCIEHAKSFTCALLGKHTQPTTGSLPSLLDPRFRAMSIAAPALGFTMTRNALAQVTLPVQLWQAMDDAVLPAPGSVEPVRDNLPTPPEYHPVRGAGHFDFLAPCRIGYDAMSICQSARGFSRPAFHEALNRELIVFFDRTLLGDVPRLTPKP
ncbi:dienelactone hydrolase [Asaia sp. As-1742]|uniref:alpha/beta hydrolase family protein n=1 Tax=Asaia sp. As-1742 TaxID=2608325 RepID=UPI0014201546|nr:dienelactone hydrolase [Asaia sp. As-1742]NIE81306.1 dienelactone hydrolase [Asaia sp. As-1742]